jgi:branched-chain amino acid transport system substrate-binding protein
MNSLAESYISRAFAHLNYATSIEMKTFLKCCLAVLGLTVTAFASAADEVVIGAAVAQSGLMTPYDDGPLKAMRLAIDDLNAHGGVLGKKVRLVVADTKSDPNQSVNAALSLLQQGAVMLMVSCDFDYGAPAAMAAQGQKVVSFSSCAADPKFGVSGIGPYAYSMGVETPGSGALLAEWAYRQKKYQRVYELKDTMIEYTKSLCDAFDSRWKALAGPASVVGQDTFHGVNDTTIANQITRIKSAPQKPDVIMFCGAVNGGSVLRQLRAAGITTTVISADSMDGDYWLKAVPDLSNFYVATYGSVFGNDPDQKINQLVARFKQTYGAAPLTGHALTGYSVVEAWALAAKRVGSFDGDRVRKQLDAFNKEPLLVGPTSFTPAVHNGTTRPMLIQEVTAGKHTPVVRVSAEQLPKM